MIGIPLPWTGGYSGEPVDGPGECIELEGFSEILCMAWRQDNQGPQDPNEVSLHLQ